MADLAKDLPDPLDTPAGGPAADPDDLVAQLAGDAIDRLLEDAEKGIVPPRPPPEDDPLNEIDLPDADAPDVPAPAAHLTPTPASDSSTPVESATEPVSSESADPQVPDDDDAPALETPTPDPTELDPVAPEPPDLVAPDAIASEPQSEPSDPPATADADADAHVPPAMQAELDSLFNSLGGDASDTPDAVPDEPSPATATADPQPAPAQAPGVAHSSMPPPVDVPPEIANDDGHGGGLAADDHRPSDPDDDASLQTDVKQLLHDAQHDSPASAPGFIIAPLRLLNAPFAGLSDPTRDTLGQIALVTLVNALAIMLYVILFR